MTGRDPTNAVVLRTCDGRGTLELCCQVFGENRSRRCVPSSQRFRRDVSSATLECVALAALGILICTTDSVRRLAETSSL